MKLKHRHLVAAAAALAALTAFPLAASAADETGCTDDACETTFYDATGHCCEDWTTVYDNCEIYFDTLRSGDIDENGKVQIADAVMLARYIAEDSGVVLSSSAKRMADCNMDNSIDSGDLAFLLTGLCSSERYLLIFWADENGVIHRPDETAAEPETGITTTTTTTVWDCSADETATTDETADFASGYLGIYNLGMSEEENMKAWGIHAPKTVYQIGEELDLSNMILEGGGYAYGCYWDIFPLEEQVFLTDQLDLITVDASEFDNTKPGTYTIYLRQGGECPADGEFQVTVLPCEPPEGTQCTESGTEEEKSWGTLEVFNINMTDEESMTRFNVPALKTVYRIGEALDLSNLVFIGNGEIVTQGHKEYWDIFPPQILGQSPGCDILVDASEFDSNTPGTYTIYLEWPDMGPARGKFRVTVLPYDLPKDTQCTESGISEGDVWLDGGKREYRVGEELDIADARVYGCGTIYEQDGSAEGRAVCEWDAFGEYSLAECVESGTVRVDASRFDSTKPGEYTIYLSMYDGENGPCLATGSFTVTVSG